MATTLLEGEQALSCFWLKRCLFLVRRGDVQAAWSGIRPLVIDPSSKNTQSISRNHVVEVSPSGLVTIAGN